MLVLARVSEFLFCDFSYILIVMEKKWWPFEKKRFILYNFVAYTVCDTCNKLKCSMLMVQGGKATVGRSVPFVRTRQNGSVQIHFCVKCFDLIADKLPGNKCFCFWSESNGTGMGRRPPSRLWLMDLGEHQAPGF